MGNFVVSGNYIIKQDTQRFRSLLDRVIVMDKVESLLSRTASKGPDPSSKGAGLGLIETARKATWLEYSVADADEDRNFITIKAVI